MRAGAASMGSWATYGLGSENQDLPGFVVLLSGGTDPTGGKSVLGQRLFAERLSRRAVPHAGEPILYANNPDGHDRETRRRTSRCAQDLNEAEWQIRRSGNGHAHRAVRAGLSDADGGAGGHGYFEEEPEAIRTMYGAKPGEASFANNCLLARRLVEQGVRFVQLFDWGWDMHGTGKDNDLLTGLPKKCREVDQASAALVAGSEAARPARFHAGRLGRRIWPHADERSARRLDVPRARSSSALLSRCGWPAAGSRRACTSARRMNSVTIVAEDKVTVRDLQATVLHLFGLDPYRFSYQYLGLNQRLIGPTDEGQVVKALLA